MNDETLSSPEKCIQIVFLYQLLYIGGRLLIKVAGIGLCKTFMIMGTEN